MCVCLLLQDDKFGKHPERLNTKDLLKTARASALAKMVKRTTREEVVVNRLMYEWEERWRQKNDRVARTSTLTAGSRSY